MRAEGGGTHGNRLVLVLVLDADGVVGKHAPVRVVVIRIGVVIRGLVVVNMHNRANRVKDRSYNTKLPDDQTSATSERPTETYLGHNVSHLEKERNVSIELTIEALACLDEPARANPRISQNIK